MKNTGIYAIQNTLNDKVYIGSAININSRWAGHKRFLKKGSHGNPPLQRAWNKYHPWDFEFKILVYCAKEYLDLWEQIAIDGHLATVGRDKMYNISLDVAHPRRSTSSCHTQEFRDALAQRNRERVWTPQQRRKASENGKRTYPGKVQRIAEGRAKTPGYKFARMHARSEESKRKTSKTLMGRVMSKETVEKIVRATKNRSHEVKASSIVTRRKLAEKHGYWYTKETSYKMTQHWKGSVWVVLGDKSARVRPEDVDEYLRNGWKRGRSFKKQ